MQYNKDGSRFLYIYRFEGSSIGQSQNNVYDININLIIQYRALICGIEVFKLENAGRDTNRAADIFAGDCRTSNCNSLLNYVAKILANPLD